MPEQPTPAAARQVLLYETRQVRILLEERGVHLEREGLSTMSDKLGLVTRPPDNDRRPRRWTMPQIEFIAAATRLSRLRATDAMAALAVGDRSQLDAYLVEVQACVHQVVELAPAAHADADAVLRSVQPAATAA